MSTPLDTAAFRTAVAHFRAVQHAHRDLGAEDTEAEVAFQVLLWDAVHGKPFPPEDPDWQLYSRAGGLEAHTELTEAARRCCDLLRPAGELVKFARGVCWRLNG